MALAAKYLVKTWVLNYINISAWTPLTFTFNSILDTILEFNCQIWLKTWKFELWHSFFKFRNSNFVIGTLHRIYTQKFNLLRNKDLKIVTFDVQSGLPNFNFYSEIWKSNTPLGNLLQLYQGNYPQLCEDNLFKPCHGHLQLCQENLQLCQGNLFQGSLQSMARLSLFHFCMVIFLLRNIW